VAVIDVNIELRHAGTTTHPGKEKPHSRIPGTLNQVGGFVDTGLTLSS
jgi:hypothetical protein